MAFDASPSWSGFNYQGKVALYYSLRLINSTLVESDFTHYSLMLEGTEDFEILYDGSPVSIHQVKAYNSSNYSKYSNALLEITIELYKQPIVVGKIHTWKQINPKQDFNDLENSIKNDLKVILEQYQNSNPKNGSTILEKAASSENNKPKLAAIIKAALPDRTELELFDILNSIYTGQNDALARLDVYQYEDDNKYCDISEINNKIKSEISRALDARSITVTLEQQESTFHYFLGVMDKYIIQRHKTKQNEKKIQITFSEIIQVLAADHEDIGNEYLACKFKEKFARLIDEYIEDPEDYEEPEGNELCNLKEVRKILLSLNPQELWAHYRTFSPHIYLKHDNNTDNALVTDTDGIRYVLIKIFHKINFERASHNASNNMFTYRTTTAPHQNYLPTTITNTARATKVERQITSNPNMSEILFEIENLIYNGLEAHTFSPTSMVHTEAPQAEDEDPRSKREEVLKQITLVPISAAKDALK